MTQTDTNGRGIRRTLQGVVTSSARDKTIAISVTRTVRHPKYHKFLKKHDRYHAHDENNTCNNGDVVVIEEARAYSKTKRWRLKQIVEKAAE